MAYILKNNEYIKDEKESTILKLLYNTIIGRIILKILTKSFISNLYSKYMNSKFSKHKIKRFIKKNNINMDEYLKENYKSFNDFFMRKIKKENRPIKDGIISVCDSKLSVYKINNNTNFKIKNSIYTINELIQEENINNKYKYALVFRLCVSDYHHYIFPDNGKIIKQKRIDGILHTVRPIAFKKYKVFNENSREVTFLNCETLGNVCYVEVGAMFVGKIVNEKLNSFKKGQEKGHFEFGGSTIVMLIENGKINNKIINNTKKGIETIVKMGETIS